MTLPRLLAASLVTIALAALAAPALANNTSGVHGPVIDPDDSSAMYRASFVPGEDGADDKWAHRLHYQRAINDRFRWRAITQFRERNDDFEYDYLRAELLWYVRPSQGDNWDSALRFDFRTRKGDRPEQVSVHWTNQWALSPKWRLRGILTGNWQFNGTATTGTQAELRSSLTYKLDAGPRVGLEMFNNIGKVTDAGSFDDQSHQLGPVISGSLFGDVSYQVGYLTGLSDGADDHDIRVWFEKRF